MKVYDKDIYAKQESIKFTILIIIVFLVGFFAGYLANSFSPQKDIDNDTNKTIEVENVSNKV